ncbi:hypothetical protein ACL9RF_07330 [Sphingobacterium sp. Mn56C]|uniref:hypothetical protein n=1 Tax=Sphingobacterium sp. Mn56C TaxID=3395261 RepID=UPI003BBA6252
MEKFKVKISSVFIYLFLATVIALSCSKKIEAIEENTDENNTNNIDSLKEDPWQKLTVVLTDIVFAKDKAENAEFNVNTKVSSRLRDGGIDNQVAVTKLPNNFYMVTTVHANVDESPVSTINPMPTSGNAEETNSTILNNNIKYKVVVFDKTGNYVKEKDFVNSNKFPNYMDSLLMGEKYTFIVYSVNSKTKLPALKFDNPQTKTLKTANVTVNEDQDFLYFRKDWVLPTNVKAKFSVKLQHLVSQVTILVDASATGYPIKRAIANIGQNTRVNSVKLENGKISKGGKSNAKVSFPALKPNEKKISSFPISVIGETGISCEISSIQIGGLNFSKLVPFKKFKINPGLKYTLKVKIVPADSYLIHENWPAARINGVIWSRFNVGVDAFFKDRDPDRSPMTVDRHGDYFQWGRAVSAAQHNSYRYVNFYSAANLVGLNNFWNGGSEKEPLKSFTDPCPRGYRIPTKREMKSLIDGTIATNLGEFHGLSKEGEQYTQDFSVAKVFTSKQNKNVMLTLPAQGYFEQEKGKDHSEVVISLRSSVGKYYVSYASDDVSLVYLYFDKNKVTLKEIPTADNDVMRSKEAAYVVRCVEGDTNLDFLK